MTRPENGCPPTFPRARVWLVAFGLLLVVLWAYWPALATMARKWARDPQYSHGYLVPLFALALLWSRRDRLAAGRSGPSLWGAALLAAAFALRVASAYLYFDWLDGISLVPCLAGLFLLAGGWNALRWSWQPVAFLAFMVPLPNQVEEQLGRPLQSLATGASTYALQTLGFAAVPEGNRILLNESTIGVVEACNGLRMLLLFTAVCAAVALVIRRPPLDKVLLLLSAVPIALASNVVRITATGVVSELVGRRAADAVFHDFAGWLMMPLALALLWLELWVLSRLFTETEPAGPLPLSPRAGAGQKGAPRGPRQPALPPA